MLCLITNDESLQKQFILVSSILKTSLIEAQSLPEILQHFSTKLCQGVIFDKRHPDLNEVDRTLWIKEHLPQETFIVFIDPPLQNEEIQKIFLDFQAMQPPEYPIPEFLLQEYIQEIPEKIKNLKNLYEALQNNYSLENLINLRLAVHKIAGNAGTYGFMPVSAYCKECEIELLHQIDQYQNKKVDLNQLKLIESYLVKIIKRFCYEK